MTKLLAVFFALLAPAFGAYRYYYSDPLTVIDPTRWAQSPEGLLLSRIAVPDGTSDYEISTRLTLAASGGVYTHYLRASADARPLPAAAGSFYAVEFQDPRITPAACIGTLAVYRQQNGVSTLLAMTEAPCRNGSVMRSVRTAERVEVYLDNVPILTVADSSIPAGQPGVGVRQAPAGNAIALVELGTLDRVAPNAPDRAAIGVSAFPDFVDMQWPAATDDPAGTGILRYEVFRDGRLLARTPNRFTDAAVSGGATYEYSILAVDYHGNRSQPASVTVTTPASAVRRPKQAGEPKSAAANAVGPGGSLDPRRIGIRALGTYWGDQGEQIDVRSGNLNFTIPLLSAMARNNWSVSFTLNYNSQLWRQDPGGTWKLGQDVGYGYGWRLMAGALFPYWSDPYTLDHYVFIDNSGAEYRLDINTNGVWSSIEGIYIWYDQAANRLYFPDGSFWVMGSTSAGTEEDAGTLYPTTFQDSNGNQMFVRYNAGRGMPNGNTSARISEIDDYRGQNYGKTYLFSYNGDTVPHLTAIGNYLSSSEKYSFGYQPQALYSPWGQPSGSTTLLTTITNTALSLTQQLAYDASGSGELAQATLPYGAHLRWTYANAPYSGSRVLRAVQYRYFAPSAGAAETTHVVSISLSGTEAMPPFSCLTGPDNLGQRCWWWFTDASPYIGLPYQHEERLVPWGAGARNEVYTWVQDAAGTPYIGTVVTTLEPGTANAIQSKTEQVLDVRGNVTETRLYGYGNLSTPARTFQHTYLTDAAYTSRYMFNRLVRTTLVSGGTSTWLVSRSYDSAYYCSMSVYPAPTSLDHHDSANYGSGFSTRGNVAFETGALAPDTCYARDISGAVRGQTRGGHGVSVDTSTANYAAPGVVTPGSNANLATRFTYTGFMALNSTTGPNGAAMNVTYDAYGRPSQSTSPHGATTTYAYTTSPPTITATTNGRFVRTTYDGLHRVVKEERGDGAPSNIVVRSVVDTEYAACACSPTGKLKRVSQTYAPGQPVNWTAYTYDGLGRTLSVATADGASTTTYSYTANRTTVTDPAGKWKTFANDAFGNLVQVTEPNPAGGNVETYYTYDGFNNLTQVSMPRDGYTQTRTFVYNGRLLTSTTNPENGTVTYTYNPDRTVATRTPAAGGRLNYEYDTYGRLARTRYYLPGTFGLYDAGVNTEYYYDSNPFDPYVSEYASGRLAAVSFSNITYMYGYTPAGRVKTKRLRMTGSRNYVDLDTSYTYDNEGRVVTLQYPSGQLHTYSFDSMGRPNRLTETANGTTSDLVQGVQYGAAGQITQMVYGNSFGTTETRQYNSLLQLTRITGRDFYNTAQYDVEYRYSVNQNNGRITQQKDWVSGEEVTYGYDSLQRLVSAVTTGPEWGLNFGYDGFGNLTRKTVTKGSAPSLSVSADPATNRLSGMYYDANGNVTNYSGPSYGYDLQNRLVSGTKGSYVYDHENRRVRWDLETLNGMQRELYIYGAYGEKLETYDWYYVYANEADNEGTLQVDPKGKNNYFDGKLISGGWTDRLGSVRGGGKRYYPYGEEMVTTANNTEKFATYFRDNDGIDYAHNRYYDSRVGRFLSPDPHQASAGLADPQSWNRYAYVGNDPVNFDDPSGLQRRRPGFCIWQNVIGSAEGALFLTGISYLVCEDDAGDFVGSRPDPCDRANPVNAKVLDFIDRNRDAAESLAKSLSLSADFILAWAAFESDYGKGSAAKLDNNNFFGLTASSKGGTGGWFGALPCSQKTGPTFNGFACFPTDEVNDMYGGNNLYYSGLAALTSQNNRYLNAALAAQTTGGDISAIANSIAKAGFNSEPINYGAKVNGAASAIKRRKDCQ